VHSGAAWSNQWHRFRILWILRIPWFPSLRSVSRGKSPLGRGGARGKKKEESLAWAKSISPCSREKKMGRGRGHRGDFTCQPHLTSYLDQWGLRASLSLARSQGSIYTCPGSPLPHRQASHCLLRFQSRRSGLLRFGRWGAPHYLPCMFRCAVPTSTLTAFASRLACSRGARPHAC
jgi:hypothetical protein